MDRLLWLTLPVVLGFAGSYHCVLMCGAIALKLRTASLYTTILEQLVYSLGRSITYAAMAAALYTVHAAGVLSGGQNIVSLIIGSIVLVFTVTRLFAPSLHRVFPTIDMPVAQLGRLRSLMNKPNQPALLRSLIVGLINGFLPCGFVYMALGGALLHTDIKHSMGFMMLFGFGTIPAFLLMLAGASIPFLHTISSSRYLRIAGSTLVGLLLLLRGLSLGIPFFSPSLPSNVQVLSDIKHEKTCLPQTNLK